MYSMEYKILGHFNVLKITLMQKNKEMGKVTKTRMKERNIRMLPQQPMSPLWLVSSPERQSNQQSDIPRSYPYNDGT